MSANAAMPGPDGYGSQPTTPVRGDGGSPAAKRSFRGARHGNSAPATASPSTPSTSRRGASGRASGLGQRGHHVWSEPATVRRPSQEDARPRTVPRGAGDATSQRSLEPWPDDLRLHGSAQSLSAGWSKFSAASSMRGSRFTAEEMNSMRKVVSPSADCAQKASGYWSNTGEVRQQLTDSHWHTLPVLKGKFFNLPKLKSSMIPQQGPSPFSMSGAFLDTEAEPLPDERMTASVLESIYPRAPQGAAKATSAPVTPAQPVGSAATDLNAASVGASSRQSTTSVTQRFQMGRHASASSSAAALLQRPSSPAGLQPQQLFASTGSLHPAQRVEVSIADARQGESASASWVGGPVVTHAGSSNTQTTTAAASSTRAPPSSTSAIGMLGELRRQLAERFGSVGEAFEVFAADVPSSRAPTRKEWLRVLQKHGLDWLSKGKIDFLFDHIDKNGDGALSVTELMLAVEATAPLRTMEALRQRWLAFGFTSMIQAIQRMDESPGDYRKRLSLKEFGLRLSKVAVAEPSEHAALFDLLRVDRGIGRTAPGRGSDMQARGTVSIAELQSAVAAVSPHLMLEDLRDRLLKKHQAASEIESLTEAFKDVDTAQRGFVFVEEFTSKAKTWAIGEAEAEKVFETIDIDASGTMSLKEFVVAMVLSTPSLRLEDMRFQLRRRFWSLQRAFNEAFEDARLFNKEASLKLERFLEIIAPLQMKESEARALFELFDTDQDGDLTVTEFWKGVQHFSPACALEHLRVSCVQKRGSVLNAFTPVEDWHKPVQLEEFKKVINDLQILDMPSKRRATLLQRKNTFGPAVEDDASSRTASTSVPIGKAAEKAKRAAEESTVQEQKNTESFNCMEKVVLKLDTAFELLDARNSGATTVGELLAALRCCSAGSTARLSDEERDTQARQRVEKDMQEMQMLCSNLKAQVRHGLRWREVKEEDEGQGESVAPNVGAASGGGRPGGSPTRSAHRSAAGSPRISARSGAAHGRPNSNDHRRSGAAPGRPVGGPAQKRRADEQQAARAEDGALQSTDDLLPELFEDSSKFKAKTRSAPLLRAVPAEEVTKMLKAGTAGQYVNPRQKGKADIPTQVPGIQKTWNNIWDCLHNSPWADSRAKMERDAQSYFASATWSLSQDTPLLGISLSQAALHSSMQHHHEALRPNKLRGVLG